MSYKRVVIKIGTSSLTYKTSMLNLKFIDKLARIVADLRNQEIDVVLVSSGAIAVGARRLGLRERPRDTCGKQAASAVGQGILMQIYEKIFIEYNQVVAQILLTKDIVDMPNRRMNTENSMGRLLELGVVPIVNENDAISSDGVEFSENDTLAAYVATLVNADLLINLSDIDGLYDSDPNKYFDAKKIAEVNVIDDYIKGVAKGSNSAVGSGGMASKIHSAEICFEKNIEMVIASGENAEIIYDIINGDQVGTRFVKK